ncbi:hypothetical protein CC85DRAFT_253259, partial [Cutaneotrichosporon oleaginosum]
MQEAHTRDLNELQDARQFITNSTRRQSAPLREASAVPTTTTVISSGHPRLKASELPKFAGKDGEDVDHWISKVDAIFTYSGVSNRDLLQILPLILTGKASNWFANLTPGERDSLTTWELWKDALRNAFHIPNHDVVKRRECMFRSLRANESMSDYFDDKTSLQKQVFPASTPIKDLINDLIMGIPMSMQPMIKSSMWEVHSLEDFRRLLIDLEPGLRPSFKTRSTNPSASTLDSKSRASFNTIRPSPSFSSYRSASSTPSIRSNQAPNRAPVSPSQTLPKTPCWCGGMHWQRDCPNRAKPPTSNPRTNTAQVNRYSPPQSSVNSIPNNNGSRWPSRPKTNTLSAESLTPIAQHR